MLNKHKLQRIAIATSALMAFGTTQLIANAETLTINGSITGPTCAVNISGTGTGGGSTGTYTMNLGNVTQSSGTTAADTGTTFGTAVTSTFALTAPGSTTPGSCVSNGAVWDISVAPTQPGFILTAATGANKGLTYLKNFVSPAQGGTDAAVVLKAGVATASPTTVLALNDNGVFAGINSTLPTFTTNTASSISISAQFVNGTDKQKPTSGTFNHTLNLGVTYR